MDEKLENYSKDLEQWQKNLSLFVKNVDMWEKISNDSTSHFKDLQSDLIKINSNLFLNRLNEFKRTRCFADSSSFNSTIRYNSSA